MLDGLYINNLWICAADEVRLTLQANDLTKPNTLQCSYSTGLTLPDSLVTRKLTANAEAVDSGSLVPYSTPPAYVVQNGQITFQGLAQFEGYQGAWTVSLIEAKKDFFERMNRALSTADFSRYDFTWNLPAIERVRSATSGVVFPLVDYGLISDNRQASDLLLPAMYVHSILEQMALEEGYRLVGLESTPESLNMVLPFTNETPTNKDGDWVADRQARVTVQDFIPYSVDQHGYIDEIMPFYVDDRPTEGFSQGRNKNFKPDQHAYVCDTSMRLLIDVSVSYKLKITAGAVELRIVIKKNGVKVDEVYHSEAALYNLLELTTDVLSYSGAVPCQAGDVITVHYQVASNTTINYWFFTSYRDNTLTAVFAPDPTVRFGDFFPVSRNLPDLTGLGLLKLVAFQYCGTWSVSDRRKEVTFIPFTPIIENRADAVDWSLQVDQGSEGRLTPQLEPYTRTNLLTYKPSDDVTKGYGDGSLSGGAGSIVPTPLFELPVSAAMPSVNTITGIDTIPAVPIRVASTSGGSPTLKATTPRVLLVHPNRTVSVTTQILNGQNEYVDALVNLRVCWFDVRPLLLASEPPQSLNFTALIPKYYTGLAYVLRRPRVVECNIYLRPVDIASINLFRLVHLSGTRAGSLLLSNGWYYVNRISNYQPGVPTSVMLIAL